MEKGLRIVMNSNPQLTDSFSGLPERQPKQFVISDFQLLAHFPQNIVHLRLLLKFTITLQRLPQFLTETAMKNVSFVSVCTAT